MGRRLYTHYMGACREMRLPRSESESQSMSFSGALDSLVAGAGAGRRPELVDLDRGPVLRRLRLVRREVVRRRSLADFKSCFAVER